jgi:hypothetical protein
VEPRAWEGAPCSALAQVRNNHRFSSGFTCNIRRTGGDPCPPDRLRRPAATGGDLPGHLQARLALLKGPGVHRHGNDEPHSSNGRPVERNLEGRRDTRFGRTGCFTCNIRATQVPRRRRRGHHALEGAGSLSRQAPRPFVGARPGMRIRPWCESAPRTGAQHHQLHCPSRQPEWGLRTLPTRFTEDHQWTPSLGLGPAPLPVA